MPPTVGSHTILVVEDHKDLRELVVLFVHSRGYEVVQAASGAEAIQETISADPKFILLDIRLPDMNGVEVARRILALRPDIPIVGWIADYVSGSYLERLLEAGFRAESHFEVPLDSITARELKRIAGRRMLPTWPGVKHLKPELSARFQAVARSEAKKSGIARVHLDAIWWSFGRDR